MFNLGKIYHLMLRNKHSIQIKWTCRTQKENVGGLGETMWEHRRFASKDKTLRFTPRSGRALTPLLSVHPPPGADGSRPSSQGDTEPTRRLSLSRPSL